MTRALAIAALVLAPGAAPAQEEGTRLAFTLGAGVGVTPDYFGSDESQVGPDFAFSLGRVVIGPLRFGPRDGEAEQLGWGFRGSFRYVPERSSDDNPELAGLPDVPLSIELGGGVDYAQAWWEAFAVARYGVIGHEALVGEIGMDLIARPADRLTLRAGPRIQIASADFMDTYFGTPGFDPGAGVWSSGVEVTAAYALGGAWGIEASARYDRLQRDAARSPISESDDQFSASLALTRRFDFRF